MSNRRKPAGAKKPAKSAVVKKADLGDNPFQIESGVVLTANRSSSSLHIHHLLERIRELPVSKEVSILIPKNIAEKASDASNLVLGVRRLIAEDASFPKNFTITLKTFKDNQGNYLNARIWRIH